MSKLPKIKELYGGDLNIIAKENDLNLLLNHEPKKEWIRSHPIASGVKFIPIEIVEYLLTSIYVKWNVEIRETKIIANSVVVTIRLHVRNPITTEMDFQDGIGAAPLQTAKEAGAIEFDKIKSDAVMKAAPAAESYAIKDAAEKLGKIFGKDLNRRDSMGYDALGKKFVDMATPEQLSQIDILRGQTTLEDHQLMAMDEEVFNGVTEERAYEIISMLEMNRNNDGDTFRQKDIQNKLDLIDKDERK